MLNWRKTNTLQYCSWMTEFEDYNFDIYYRKGEQHIDADAFSRFPQCRQCELRHDDPKLKRNIKFLDDNVSMYA